MKPGSKLIPDDYLYNKIQNWYQKYEIAHNSITLVF